MGIGLRGAIAGVLVGLAVGAGAQTATAISVTPTPLLPEKFGGWVKTTALPLGVSCSNVANSCQSLEFPLGSSMSLAKANQDALEEDGPQRSAVGDYSVEDHGGKIMLHIEAIQFGDRTGAYSAFTLMKRPGMKEGKDLGSLDAIGDGAILFTSGATLVLVTGGSGNMYEVASLKPLADALPKVFGSKAVAPLLPTLLPTKGLVSGSLRYAVGPASYAAEGGVLPANSIGWDKSAEAVTAQYEDARGKETLTLLLYPTPNIAGAHVKAIEALAGNTGNSKVRREGLVVALATGSFTGADAQALVESVHNRELVNMDKEMELTPHEKAMQGYSLLKSIAILALVLMGAAVLLGVFLGGGRAAIRVMRGKPAAVEVEFLSLHLSPQNKPAQFGGQERGNSG
jgi:hypothetical protein